MQNISFKLLIAIEIIVMAFIVSTSGSLPEMVASHFNGSGVPNGYMSKTFYIYFMIALTLTVPSIVAVSITFIRRFPDEKINLPNKKVWLDSKNRESTFAFLEAHALGMALLVSLFMGFVHWLVVKANTASPAHLSSEAITTGLLVFALVLVGWGIMLPVKFMRPPKEGEAGSKKP